MAGDAWLTAGAARDRRRAARGAGAACEPVIDCPDSESCSKNPELELRKSHRELRSSKKADPGRGSLRPTVATGLEFFLGTPRLTSLKGGECPQ